MSMGNDRKVNAPLPRRHQPVSEPMAPSAPAPNEPREIKPRKRSQRNKIVGFLTFIAANAAALDAVALVLPAVIPPGTGAATAAIAGAAAGAVNQFWKK